MRFYLAFFLFLISPLLANEKCSMEVQAHRVSASEVILGVTLTPIEGWHTYWSNPGESGLALSIELEDAGVKVLADEFPVPQRYVRNGIITYEYGEAATFLYSLSGEIPDQLKGVAQWLVCDKDSCLPADGNINLTIPKKVAEEEPTWLKAAVASQPMILEVSHGANAVEGKKVTYTFSTAENISGWEVYPYSNSLKDLQIKVAKTEAPAPAEAPITETTEPEEGDEVAEEEVPEVAPLGDFYKLEFQFKGEAPEGHSFLITNGEKAYTIIL